MKGNKTMFDLTGKLALVTGSSRGIGKAIAHCLALRGASVIINYAKNKNEAENTVNEFKASGLNAVSFKADVTNEKEVKELYSFIMEKFGKLDILVNNAGTSQAKDIFEMELSDWDNIINTNLTSAFLCTKYAMEIMKKQNYGRIISISSQAGERGALFGHAHYAASKSGVLALTKTVARTAAPYGITVNSIAPGVIFTEFTGKVHSQEEIDSLEKSIPLGLGSTDDVGAAAVYLASDEARYVTGITLDINGGSYIH